MNTTLSNVDWLILIAASVLAGGLAGFIAEGLGSRTPLTIGGGVAMLTGILGYLMLTGGL